MKKIILIIALVFMTGASAVMSAQQNNTRTAYFLDNYTYGYRLNPAFAGTRNFVSIPVLGNFSIGGESNIGLSNFLYPASNGKLALFIDDSVSDQEFLSGLKDNNKLNANLNLTLLALGFKTGQLYHTIDASFKVNENSVLPKSLFSFVKVGTANGDNSWQIGNVGIGADAMGEIAYGLSTNIGESLRIGARLKVLMGLAHADMLVDKLDISMTEENWSASTHGKLEVAGPVKFTSGSGNSIDLSQLEFGEFSGLSGFGFGIDLGASYRFLEHFTASVSLLDLGIMSWKNMTQAQSAGSSYSFDGFGTITEGSDFGQQLEGLTDELMNLIKFEKTATATGSRGLKATLHAGIEAEMPFYDRLSFGLLGTHRFNGAYSWTEGRLSANITPVDCIGLAVSGAVSEFGGSIGGIVNFVFPGINLFVGVDSFMVKVSPQFIPVEKFNTNLALGLNITFGKGQKE